MQNTLRSVTCGDKRLVATIEVRGITCQVWTNGTEVTITSNANGIPYTFTILKFDGIRYAVTPRVQADEYSPSKDVLDEAFRAAWPTATKMLAAKFIKGEAVKYEAGVISLDQYIAAVHAATADNSCLFADTV